MFCKVLLIDDDKDDQMFFSEAIEAIQETIEFLTADNGRKGIELLESITTLPDIIFLDLNMPVMNGIECLNIIKNDERWKHIPVAIFTTAIRSQEIEKTRSIGARLFLTKPGNLTILKKLVEDAIREIVKDKN